MNTLPLLLLTLIARCAGPPSPQTVLAAQLDHDVRSLAVSADGRALAVATSDRAILQWVLGHGAARPTIKLTAPVSDIGFIPTSNRLATLSNSLEIWDAQTGKRIAASADLSGAQLAFSFDGTLAVGAHWVTLVEPMTLKRLADLPEQGGWRDSCVAYSPDGKLVAAGDIAGTVWVWDTASRTQKLRRQGHVNRVNGVGFIDDGRTLVSGGADGKMKFWDLKGNREVGATYPHESAGVGRGITALVCSRDGKTIATGCATDGTVKLWEAATGQLRATLTVPGGNVTCLALAANGLKLSAGSKRGNAGSIAVWALYDCGPRLAHPVRASLWSELAGESEVAYRAILGISTYPRAAVPLLNQRMRPVVLDAAARKECDGLIAALDNDNFEVRDEASRKLEAMSPWIESHLKQALASTKTLELKRRLEALVAKVGQSTLPLIRAVEALEHAPGPEARDLLRRLAAGEPAARITREARQALDRLQRLEKQIKG